jgi:hypothetical protein
MTLMLGRFVRMTDYAVSDALISIAEVACGCYGRALRAAGTADRDALFVVAGSLPEPGSAGEAEGEEGAGPAFAPAPLELCRLAEVRPARCSSPPHLHAFASSSLELNGIM